MTTTQELYQATIIHWPTAERLRLASMILQDLTATVSSSPVRVPALDLLEQMPVRRLSDDNNTKADAPGQPQPGAAMAAALENIAVQNSLAEIADPVAWQREQRQDRILPGRKDNDN